MVIHLFAPKLYKVLKLDIRQILNHNYELNFTKEEIDYYSVNQQDNMMFRQVRLITGNNDKFNQYIVFIDCKSKTSKPEIVNELIHKGLKINNREFVLSERSASMTRNAILSMIDKSISEQINESVGMGYKIEKTVLAKYLAYRGLMFSSCHCLEGFIPKVIVVDDYDFVVKNQKINYVGEEEYKIIDKEGNEKTYKNKAIKEDVRDIKLTINDGCGFIHPSLSQQMERIIGSKTKMTSILIRFPYVKGLLFSVDYTKYYHEHNVDYIQDIWGKWHDVDEPMIILTKSQYKGYKYFNITGTSQDWDIYWERFHKYNHCIGVAKWNFSEQEEPKYTKINYQILQTLNLPYEEFSEIARTSLRWVENIVYNDPIATMIFLGITADECDKDYGADFMSAIRKNVGMLNEPCVKNYVKNLLTKTIDEFKCGKLWVKGSFKFIAPDLIMCLQYIGGLDVTGSLEVGECFAKGCEDGKEYVIDRNPHICQSENCVVVNRNKDEILKYCGHLENVCITNSKGVIAPQLNGCDFDGDIIFMIDDPIILKGSKHNLPITMNVDDKATTIEEYFDKEGVANTICRGLKSMIGEISNYTTALHNKQSKSERTQKTYSDWINLLSVLNGVEIDAAKTGLHPNIPPYIAKNARPLPYFMKYTGEYYSKKEKLSKSFSNMNRLAFDIERWQDRRIKNKRIGARFDYHIMFNDDLLNTDWLYEISDKIELLMKEYNAESQDLWKFQVQLKNYSKYKGYFKSVGISKEDAENIVIDWKLITKKYREKMLKICDDVEKLAYACVYITSIKYRSKENKMAWKVIPDGMVKIIKEPETSQFPFLDEEHGFYEYLGRKYSLALKFNNEESFFEIKDTRRKDEEYVK